MPRPKAVTISRPFDARHVAGVDVMGAKPVEGMQRAFTSTLEPDEKPTHFNMSLHAEAAPKRSNTIAHTLSRPSLRLKTSISRLRGRSSSHPPDMLSKKERDSTPEPKPGPKPAPKIEPVRAISSQRVPEKKLPTRPRRADSGTAIDFDEVPVNKRPMGFQEIMQVKSFAERMALYKKTRDYWASADHGLDEWVGRARMQRPLVAQV